MSDLLHAVYGVASHHGISASGLRGSNPHSHRNRRHTGGTSRFTSRDRAMARSHRPHLRPSHRQTCVLWYASLRRSSTSKHVVQTLKRTPVGYPARQPTAVYRPGLSFDSRLKTRVCTINYYQVGSRLLRALHPLIQGSVASQLL